MLQKEIDQYKIRYEIENYMCYVSNKPATQIAHRIADTRANRSLYGKDTIDHNFNLVPVANLEINSSFNIGNNPGKCMKLYELINKRYKERLTAKEITDYINE